MLQQRRLEESSNCTVKPDCLRVADCEVRYASSTNGTGGNGQNPYTVNGDEPYGGFQLPYNEIPCDSFPFKLHALLSDVEKQGHGHIASWQPHGKRYVKMGYGGCCNVLSISHVARLVVHFVQLCRPQPETVHKDDSTRFLPHVQV